MDTFDRIIVTIMLICALTLSFIYASAELDSHVAKYHKNDHCTECGKKK